MPSYINAFVYKQVLVNIYQYLIPHETDFISQIVKP